MGKNHISYTVLLDHWHILPENLEMLDKELGVGYFGIVQLGMLRVEEGASQAVAAKTLKGTQ